LTVILALTPLAQTFWFGWAWRAIGAAAWPGPRVLLQGLWTAAVLVVVTAGLDLLGVRVILVEIADAATLGILGSGGPAFRSPWNGG
jgi:hypothetical protein